MSLLQQSCWDENGDVHCVQCGDFLRHFPLTTLAGKGKLRQQISTLLLFAFRLPKVMFVSCCLPEAQNQHEFALLGSGVQYAILASVAHSYTYVIAFFFKQLAQTSL